MRTLIAILSIFLISCSKDKLPEVIQDPEPCNCTFFWYGKTYKSIKVTDTKGKEVDLTPCTEDRILLSFYSYIETICIE